MRTLGGESTILSAQSLRDSFPRVGAKGDEGDGLPRQCAHYSAPRAGFAGCALYTPAGVVVRNDVFFPLSVATRRRIFLNPY